MTPARPAEEAQPVEVRYRVVETPAEDREPRTVKVKIESTPPSEPRTVWFERISEDPTPPEAIADDAGHAPGDGSEEDFRAGAEYAGALSLCKVQLANAERTLNELTKKVSLHTLGAYLLLDRSTIADVEEICRLSQRVNATAAATLDIVRDARPSPETGEEAHAP